MLKHSAARSAEPRTGGLTGTPTLMTIFAVAATLIGLGVVLTLTNNLLLFGLGLLLIGCTLQVAFSTASDAHAKLRAAR
ncbi:MAG TPA: hypothetical protein PKE42_03150 [Arachnia sp.]|jgi:hypothetical protein|nr:hypothetical protein [Arachnia sp.]